MKIMMSSTRMPRPKDRTTVGGCTLAVLDGTKMFSFGWF